jgi:hypothetical protein
MVISYEKFSLHEGYVKLLSAMTTGAVDLTCGSLAFNGIPFIHMVRLCV